MSFVGATPKGKRLPNPNVMTEFGYARSMLDDQQIVLVMNTAFGPERDLPFDLAHLRHPAAYALQEGAADAERRRARTAFAQKIAPFLQASIRFVLERRAKATVSPDVIAPAYSLLAELDQLSARHDVPALVPGPKLVVRLIPAAASGEPYLEPLKVKAARRLFVPEGYERTLDKVDARQWANFDPPRHAGEGLNSGARWYVRLVRPGALEASIIVGARIDDDRTIIVEGRPLEGRIVELGKRLASIADELGLGGPMLLNAALHGLEDVQIMTSRQASRPLGIPGLFLGTVALPSMPGFTAEALRVLFDALWLGSGFDGGTPSFQGDGWEGDSAPVVYQPATIGGRAWR